MGSFFKIDRPLEQAPPVWQTFLLCLSLTILGVVLFAGIGIRWAALLAGIGIISLLMSGELRRLWNWPALLLMGYAAFSMLTALWAMSGKFFLREYTKIFIAAFFFLLTLLRKRDEKSLPRRVMGIVAGMSAIYAAMSVEANSTGMVKALLYKIPSLDGSDILFGNRLWGIFGNPNIEASVYVIGILFSVALVCASDTKWRRVLFSVTLSLCAFAFLLALSLGAMGCFAAAVVIYLIFAGEGRGAALARMLGAAVPTVLFALLASRYFNAEGWEFLPPLMMFINAGTTVALELTLAGRLAPVLQTRQKRVFGAVICVVVLAAAYVAIGTLVTAPYTFGAGCESAVSLDAGKHILRLDADGEVVVIASSQDRQQVWAGSVTQLISWETEKVITFTVPEDSLICSFGFNAQAGVTLRSAMIDGNISLPLSHPLLPDFLEGRLQNIWLNSDLLGRLTYIKDTFKLFLRSPIIGSGVGAFETGVTSVQEYSYQTKYVHNHYMQILLEDGVIGYALFVGALVAMAAALWKKRRQPKEGAFFWIYPALCAEFVMNALQMLWDVSMSSIVFLCMAYAFYGLVVRTCALPISAKAAAPAAGRGGRTGLGSSRELAARLGGMLLPALYMVTLLGNLYANRLANTVPGTLDRYMSNLEQAVALDLYEYNDWKLSYLMLAVEDGTGTYLAQADRYAEELSGVQSNAIPLHLVTYYLRTGQYANAIGAAKLGATYSVSNPEVWNNAVSLLKQVFLDSGAYSPLLYDGGLLDGLVEYHAMLERYNETALRPLQVSWETQQFFDTVLALDACGGDTGAMLAILIPPEEAPAG